jgi:thioesterase domain-containing protein/acyl carrier protein
MSVSPEVVEPRTARSAQEIHAWIIAELSLLLKVPAGSIDSAAPLTSLGADSLMALRMTGGLAEWMDRDLPATLMWDFSSIDAIANALSDPARGVGSSHPGIIELQPLGDVPPLFCFPGAGGHPTTFVTLAARLAPTNPCYGLTVPGFSGERPPLEKLEDIAAAMLENIRGVQARGPYQLAGYSFGGVLAFETAQQLATLGDEVSLLALYDTYAPTGFALLSPWRRQLAHAHILATRPGRRQYLSERLANRRRARAVRDRQHRHDGDKFASQVEKASHRATQTYRPRKYPGSILLFRAIDNSAHSRHTLFNGWAALCGDRVRMIDLPGDHDGILDPKNSLQAAEKLRPFLQR